MDEAEQCPAELDGDRCQLIAGHEVDVVAEVRDVDGNVTGSMTTFGTKHRVLIEWS